MRYNFNMENIVRNVRDIDASDRDALEHVVGQALRDNQQIIIQVMALNDEPPTTPGESAGGGTDGLPDWCNVYEGLSDEEIAEVEKAILDRGNWTRPLS
jgi:hypothetical protein